MDERVEPPEWAEELEPGYVWCTECRSDLWLEGIEWPDPLDVGKEPGEYVKRFVSCYAPGFDDDWTGPTCCDADVLVQRKVNATGDGYDGEPVNVWGPDDG